MLISQYAADAESDAAHSAMCLKVLILMHCAFGAILTNAAQTIDRTTRQAE